MGLPVLVHSQQELILQAAPGWTNMHQCTSHCIPLHIPLHPTAAHRAPGMFYWDINPGLHPSKTQLIYPFVASGDRMPDTHQSSLQGACKAKPGAAFHLWRYSQHILRQGEPWSGAGHNLLILRWAEEAGMAGQREG